MAQFQNPFLRGYLGAQQAEQARTGQNIQQMGMVSQIQAAEEKRQLDANYRAEMAAADTPEKQIAVAVKHGGPSAVLSHADRQERAKSTKEATMARLSQAAQQFEANWQLRYRAAQTADERLNLERQRTAFQQSLQTEASRLAGARGAYDFGFVPGAPPAPTVTGAAPATPNPLAGRPQNELDAIALVQGGAGSARATPQGAEVVRPAGTPWIPPQGAAPAPVTAPAPMAAPPAPQPAQMPEQAPPIPTAPFTPNDPEARRLPQRPVSSASVLPSAAAPAQAPTPVRPTMPAMPPEIAAAPPRVQNQWRLQQSRPSIAGAANLTPETLTRVAQQVLAGDERALIPWSRNQQAMGLINEEITKQANTLGLTGGDIVGNRATTAANRTALTAVTKDLAAITPFKEMLDTNARVAIDLGRKIANDKTSSAFVNKPLLWVKNNMSDRPDIAEYLAQMHFIEVEAARVLTQPRLVGQLTDQAISDMKSILSGNMTIASTEAVINRILADGNNRIGAMKSQQERIRSEIQGGAPRTRSTDARTGVDTTNPLLR